MSQYIVSKLEHNHLDKKEKITYFHIAILFLDSLTQMHVHEHYLQYYT